jgi:acetyl-CoA acetyltransferase
VAGIAPDEIGVFEVHEAFAARSLRVLRELSTQFEGFVVPDDRLNLNGVAVAVGHPFGASGSRHLLTLAIAMREQDARYGNSGRVRGLRAGCGRPARERPGVNRDQRSMLPGASAEVSRSPLRSRKT